MRIVINDYSGHPFQVQLSRELSARGHVVKHVFFADFQTPKGDLIYREKDPRTFSIEGVTLGETFKKNDFIRRRGQEIRYARKVTDVLSDFRPDLVVGCNNPLDAQSIISKWCARRSIPFVFWLQDIYSDGIRSILSKKLGLAGRFVGEAYARIERGCLGRSSHVIAISNAFRARLEQWMIDPAKVSVIPNWAPLDQISPKPKDNPWSRRHGYHDKLVVMYTGTLGFKHNPMLLVQLAERFREDDRVRIVVASDGWGSEVIAREAKSRDPHGLHVLPFQPMEEYSNVLGAADVLVAVIEPDAARYSVPSKVQSYLCSGRPMVLCVPTDNQATQAVERAGAGIGVEPGDVDGFCSAVQAYLSDDARRAEAGRAGRSYAERTFDIERICAKFDEAFRLIELEKMVPFQFVPVSSPLETK